MAAPGWLRYCLSVVSSLYDLCCGSGIVYQYYLVHMSCAVVPVLSGWGVCPGRCQPASSVEGEDGVGDVLAGDGWGSRSLDLRCSLAGV